MLKRVCLASVTLVTMLTYCQTSQAQMFFEADWLYYGRSDDSSQNIVNGPESLGLSDVDFGETSGYRLTLGGSLGAVDIDGSFMQLDTWNGSSSGTFNNLILLDGVSVPGDPGMVNSLSSRTGLSQAASFISAMSADDETSEGERLRAFMDPVTLVNTDLTYQTFARSNLRQFEINIGTSRNANFWRMSAGFRHINLDERSGLALRGVFDALDVDDGNPFDNSMNDDPNNSLSNTALTSVGLTNVGGSADGFDAIFVTADPMMNVASDIMTYQILGNADNELNGAQATFAIRIFDGEWLTVEGIGKAGIYRNNISGYVQETVVGSGNDDSVYQRTLRDNEVSAAFAGNLGLRGIVSLTDYINVVLGYEVLFLSGVAIGADQADGLSTDIFGTTRYTVQNDGSLIAHGGNLGLEILW